MCFCSLTFLTGQLPFLISSPANRCQANPHSEGETLYDGAKIWGTDSIYIIGFNLHERWKQIFSIFVPVAHLTSTVITQRS